MDHLAIMKKSWGLTDKILNGEKIIESRWYSSKRAPWDKIKKGEIVYFKDSGKLIGIKATVRNVLQFSDLTPKKAEEILREYEGAIGFKKEEIQEFLERVKDKKYCILVFLKSPQKIKPFEINKAGFGMMSAWITVNNILKIKK